MMFFCSHAPVEGPRLQGTRRQEREIQIVFVSTGVSSQKAVIILGTAKRTINIACVKKQQLPPFLVSIFFFPHMPGEIEDNHGKPQGHSYFLFMFHLRMLSVAQNE